MPFDLGYRPSQFRSARPGYDGTSLQEMHRRFPDEKACFAHIIETRMSGGLSCRKCGKSGKWYQRRGAKYLQHPCGAVFSSLAGTMFHATKLPLHLWFYAMLHFANSSEGVTIGFLQRQLGISYLAAFRMARKIRLQMASVEQSENLAFGSEPVQVRLEAVHHVRSSTPQQKSVNVLIAADSERIDTFVIENPRRHTLLAALRIRPYEHELFTTCYRTARVFSAYGLRRPAADFNPAYFLDNPQRADYPHGFLSYFLCPFQNNHKSVSREHLWLYLKEFQFRYNRRFRSGDTYWDLISNFPRVCHSAQATQARRPEKRG